jgi:DNA-binding transcriptional LysR family regulator
VDHLQAIRVFCRVVETGAFNRAAQSLQMPNATVSKWVRSLETHLGVPLLERSTRRVQVTNEGTAYYERMRQLLAELDDVESTLGRTHANPRGRLRVDTGGSTASGILIPALPEFRERYPDIHVEIGVTDRVIDVVGENVDCAIRSTASDVSLIAHRIGKLRWTTCASPAYLARYGAPADPRQLLTGNYPVAGYFSARTGVIQPLHFRDQEHPFQIEPPTSVTVNESNAHLATALAGLGLIHTLDFMVRPSIERGELIPILEPWRPDSLDVYITYAPSRQLSVKVCVFVSWITEVYARYRDA